MASRQRNTDGNQTMAIALPNLSSLTNRSHVNSFQMQQWLIANWICVELVIIYCVCVCVACVSEFSGACMCKHAGNKAISNHRSAYHEYPCIHLLCICLYAYLYMWHVTNRNTSQKQPKICQGSARSTPTCTSGYMPCQLSCSIFSSCFQLFHAILTIKFCVNLIETH